MCSSDLTLGLGKSLRSITWANQPAAKSRQTAQANFQRSRFPESALALDGLFISAQLDVAFSRPFSASAALRPFQKRLPHDQTIAAELR